MIASHNIREQQGQNKARITMTCRKNHHDHRKSQKPWRNVTLTHGYIFEFRSGITFRVERNQFALIATPHRCIKGRKVCERDGFKLMQLDIGDGNIMQPIDVERLVGGENPTDPFYSAMDSDMQQQVDKAVAEQTGQPGTHYVLTSWQSPAENDVLIAAIPNRARPTPSIYTQQLILS